MWIRTQLAMWYSDKIWQIEKFLVEQQWQSGQLEGKLQKGSKCNWINKQIKQFPIHSSLNFTIHWLWQQPNFSTVKLNKYLQQFHKIFTNIQTCCRQCRKCDCFFNQPYWYSYYTISNWQKTYTVIPGYSFPENNTNDK